MEQRNPYQLSGLADCASPDSETSPGARFLANVADSVSEAWDYIPSDERADADLSDIAHEATDGCVPIYSRELWETFTDLAAWSEDLGDIGGASDDMEQNARGALYLIGSRLAYALAEELREEIEDDSESRED